MCVYRQAHDGMIVGFGKRTSPFPFVARCKHFASTLNRGSRFHGTNDRILLSEGSGSLPDAIPGWSPLVAVIESRVGLPSKYSL